MGGCFRGFFGSSFKDTKSPHHRKIKRIGSHKPLQSRFYAEQDTKTKPQYLDHRDKHEEQLSLSNRKKDTFDQIVKTYEPVSKEEDKHEEKLRSNIRKKVTFDTNVKTYEPVSVRESTELLAEIIQDNEKQKEELLEKPSLPCYPSNHRYNNCQESDEEVDELESEDIYMDDEDSEYSEEDEFESYDDTTDEISSLDMKERKPVGLGLSVGDRGVYVHPMLNPVENLDQWKALKTKAETKSKTKNLQDQSLYDSKCDTNQFQKQYRELAVDASLSNWLVSSETTFQKKGKYDGFERTSPEMSTERSILGALPVEEVRETKVSISDEMPLTGSIGTYQSYSGPRVKDIGAAFSYKRLPNTITSKYQDVLVQ